MFSRETKTYRPIFWLHVTRLNPGGPPTESLGPVSRPALGVELCAAFCEMGRSFAEGAEPGSKMSLQNVYFLRVPSFFGGGSKGKPPCERGWGSKKQETPTYNLQMSFERLFEATANHHPCRIQRAHPQRDPVCILLKRGDKEPTCVGLR